MICIRSKTHARIFNGTDRHIIKDGIKNIINIFIFFRIAHLCEMGINKISKEKTSIGMGIFDIPADNYYP